MSESFGIVMPKRTLITDLGWSGPVAAAAGAPTVLHLTSPNDFADASWTGLNASLTGSNTQLAPDNTNTASGMSANNPTGGFSAYRTTIPITMVSGTNYSLTGYIKNTAAPVWVEFFISDNSAGTNFVQFWVDTTSAAGALGNTAQGVGGVVDSGFAVTAATGPGNNYSKVVMNFHFTSTPDATAIFDIRCVDSNSGATPTIAQGYNVWGWGA